MDKKVYLIGVGLGNPDTMTAQAVEAIASCAHLIGAERLLVPYQGTQPTTALTRAQDIADFLATHTQFPVGVLLSGDVGFYSGATSLRPLLMDYDVESIAGMSSLVYFCAQLNTPWQDAKLCSAHGRTHNLVGDVQCHGKVFALTGGKAKVVDLCRELMGAGLGRVMVSVGENLSYPNQRIVRGTATELSLQIFADLSVMLIENPHPIVRPYTAPSLQDGDLLRGKVPMTKAWVRSSAVCKLQLRETDIVWDVGAGTGSVSVECALGARAGQVFAIERKVEAVALLQENKSKFGLTNLHIIEGLAPDALADLPAPDRVFLGGTAGNLEGILEVIFAKNPACRIVLTAVTLETLAQATTALQTFNLADVDITQIAVTNTRVVGNYHLFDAQNPVWMLTGEGQVAP